MPTVSGSASLGDVRRAIERKAPRARRLSGRITKRQPRRQVDFLFRAGLRDLRLLQVPHQPRTVGLSVVHGEVRVRLGSRFLGLLVYSIVISKAEKSKSEVYCFKSAPIFALPSYRAPSGSTTIALGA